MLFGEKLRRTTITCLALLALSVSAFAQPRVGEKMPVFQLQDTSDQFRGIKDGQNTVSILFFIGWW